MIEREKESLQNVVGDFELVIVGYGILSKELQKYSFVRLVGHVSHENIGTYYQDADLFLSPSLYENSSIVLREALSCDNIKYVLSTPVGDSITLDNHKLKLVCLEDFLSAIYKIYEKK